MHWKELLEKGRPRVVTVPVPTGEYDAKGLPVIEEWEIGFLSKGEWLAIDAEVPDPPIPQTLLGSNGAKQLNRADVKYQQQLAAANNERADRKLALALEKAGHELPDDMEERVAIIERLDLRVTNALMQRLARHVMGQEEKAASAAATFPD